MAELSQHRTLIAWSIFFFMVLFGLFFVIFPLLSLSAEYDDRIASSEKRLFSYQQVIGSADAYQAEYERVQKQGLDTLFYPEEKTAAQVAKELQKSIAAAISQGGGRLLSSEVLDRQMDITFDASSEDESGTSFLYSPVLVKAVFQGNMDVLRRVLHQAYQARPLVFVEYVDIKPLKKEESKGQQQVKAVVEVSTYWRGGEVNNESSE